MNSGTIILIGGLSSSGKTSVARELQKLFAQHEAPYLHIPIDAFMQFLPEQWFSMDANSKIQRQEAGVTFIDQGDEQGAKTKIQVGLVAMQLLAAYYPTLNLLAAHGNNIISDAVFNSDFLKYGAQQLAECQVYSIGIRCPLEITQARELARGAQDGGYIGLSRWYAEETDANMHDLCDFIVDSAQYSPQELAEQIYDFVHNHEPEVMKRKG